MILCVATAENFGSYRSLSFDYRDLGLALLSGPTGVGKSSLFDLAPWVLFGTTSKDLNADDVKSWFAEDATIGSVGVEVGGKTYFVTRIRGKRPSQNDLYYTVGDPLSEEIRGKDAIDTQRIINEFLGVTSDLYFAASYLHQFTADRFFTAKAKDRRESMEKIADMSLAIKLGEKAAAAKREAKAQLTSTGLAAAKVDGKVESLRVAIDRNLVSEGEWEASQAAKLTSLRAKSASFEDDKEARVYKLVDQLEVLDRQIIDGGTFKTRAMAIREQLKLIEPLDKELRDVNNQLATATAELKSAQKAHAKFSELKGTCPTCLGDCDNTNRQEYLIEAGSKILFHSLECKELSAEVARLEAAVASRPNLQAKLTKVATEEAENRRLIDKFESVQAQAISLRGEVNPFENQIQAAESESNPYTQQIEQDAQRVADLEQEQAECAARITELEARVSSLTWLYDKSYELRGLFLERSVKQINDRTNAILDKHFDATLRVRFELLDSDKLEVSITNSGYEAKYAQLSGGERCMLKLAFGLAYMQAAENTAGVKFSTLMLDEALNGFDAELKTRAFGLLQELESQYSSILLIDHHEEFKQLFSKTFTVSKDGAYSSIVADSI